MLADARAIVPVSATSPSTTGAAPGVDIAGGAGVALFFFFGLGFGFGGVRGLAPPLFPYAVPPSGAVPPFEARAEAGARAAARVASRQQASLGTYLLSPPSGGA